MKPIAASQLACLAACIPLLAMHAPASGTSGSRRLPLNEYRDKMKAGWMDVRIDLSEYAGKTILVELLNQPTGWSWEAAYWANIAIQCE